MIAMGDARRSQSYVAAMVAVTWEDMARAASAHARVGSGDARHRTVARKLLDAQVLMRARELVMQLIHASSSCATCFSDP